ncbi:MAG: protein jag [Vicinamibacterales bacterium]
MSNPTEIAAFVERLAGAMGLSLTAEVEDLPDGVRINLEGEDGNVLTRRQGELLAAVQHVVSAIYRQDPADKRRLVIDCLGYRKSKDAELRQMALFLAEKARTSGLAQEIGPLNAYERRIVHLAVSELEGVSSESIGDAFEKTVIISVS